ncbi:MAG TPA: biopolymer transporter ExbD [Spirochaetota bacterium]|nr:biopolymer transporter ExbD [Spirochaetota bacterium]
MRLKILKKKSSELDLTPLTDVIFLVLLFFMVGASFDINRSLKLELPKSFAGEGNISKNKIVIEIDSSDNIFFQGKNTDVNDISSEIVKIENYIDMEVFILGDENSSYKAIIKVLDILKILGVTNISLVTEPKEEL